MNRTQATAAVGPADPAVPLTLVTGFLGAGKTTLVNRVLSGAPGGPTVVLVNDFGAVDIDRALVAGESGDAMALVNGCICCSLRDDLLTSVMRLLQGPDAPHRVLLEASGVADPAPIASTFLAPAFRHRLRLDGIVCVVDAEQALVDPDLVPLQLRQIGFADLVILNKADLAGPARLGELAARIRAAFSGARLVEAAHCDVPAEILFSAQGSRHAAAGARRPGALETRDAQEPPRFDAWSYETAEAFCPDALHDLARLLPPSVYRAKGLVRLGASGGRAERRGILQIVGRRADLVADRAWRRDDDPSRLVFIGAAGALHSERLAALVRACLRPGT